MKLKKVFIKGEERMAVELRRWLSHANEWVGRVVGLHEKYGLALDWCKTIERKWSHSGKNGWTTFLLKEPGYYKYSEPSTGTYGREAIGYFYFNGESIKEVTETEVYQYFKNANTEKVTEEKTMAE